MENNEQIERETINLALDNLKANGGIVAAWKPGKIKELDGEVDIRIGNKTLKFLIEVKTELRNHNLNNVLDQAAEFDDFLVLAYRILPGIKQELRERGIPYMEANGNIFINRKETYIWLDQNKPIELPREKTNRAFTKTGLQVVFLFLMEPKFINRPYRVIAEAADTALGNVNNVINGLEQLGFLIRKNKDEVILNNKKDLLEKWIIAYNEKLKPTLHIGNFRFMSMNAEKDWKDFDINIQETLWGAEPGGDILTNHLRPEILTLYTNEQRKNLMEQFSIVPDERGQIKMYRKFWRHTIPIKKVLPHLKVEKAAPPILVYADLMNTNDKRCIETAKIIYERYIEPNL